MAGIFHMRLLGPVQVERDGIPVRGFRSRKALALLGYLATQNRPVPRSCLAELFWEGKTEARGRTNLSWTLNRISTLLPACLQADCHTVQLQRRASFRLDVDSFADLAGQDDLPALAAAVALYRGEFLEGLYLAGCAEFEIWLVKERERWRQRITRVLEKLVAGHSRRGEYEQSLCFAQHLLEVGPWREETHCQVMRLLAYTGRQNAALAQYETCRRTLAEALNLEPAEKSTALRDRIRQVADSLHLPAHPNPFVGREEEMSTLGDLLRNPDCRLITIGGMGSNSRFGGKPPLSPPRWGGSRAVLPPEGGVSGG